MSDLTPRERELVALGAAMGSNCVPCVEYHIPEARKAGLADPEIHAAIRLADKVRQVPARKGLQTALKLMPAVAGDARRSAADAGCGCEAVTQAANADASETPQPCGAMAKMISQMMNACGSLCRSAPVTGSADKGNVVNQTKGEGCGCS
ncbi:carboxymuconolactone decarboxylase family protein [bacterium]|nr:carboxymuconolactone decarboxylase family protein [bacterium]